MSGVDVIQAKIKKKESEIANLEKRVEAAKVYLTALNDIRKEMEKEDANIDESDATIRRGSSVDQAREAILSAGKPLHLEEILQAMGKDVTRESKASLNGSLAAYVRREETFTRPAPSTFGLVELNHFEAEREEDEPPAGFGTGTGKIDDGIPF